MGRQISISGLLAFLNTSPCAHSCDYCSAGKKVVTSTSFSRVARLMERFSDWRQKEKLNNLKLDLGIGHSDNHDLITLKELHDLRERLGHPRKPQCIYLGGLKFRSEAEMREWLKVRRDEADIGSVHAAIAGHGAVHDRWNGRPGDFDFLMQTMQTAAALGLKVRQRLFVVKSTLPLLDELLEKLNRIEAVTERYFTLFYYRGLAINFEDERLTETQRNALPPYIHAYEAHSDLWLSEREWIDHMKNKDPTQPDVVWARLHLDASNIEKIETMPVDDIFADLERRTRAAYAAVPSRQELAKMVGDPSNTRIYVHREDVERLWLDRYLRDHPITFERALTYFQ